LNRLLGFIEILILESYDSRPIFVEKFKCFNTFLTLFSTFFEKFLWFCSNSFILVLIALAENFTLALDLHSLKHKIWFPPFVFLVSHLLTQLVLTAMMMNWTRINWKRNCFRSIFNIISGYLFRYLRHWSIFYYNVF